MKFQMAKQWPCCQKYRICFSRWKLLKPLTHCSTRLAVFFFAELLFNFLKNEFFNSELNLKFLVKKAVNFHFRPRSLILPKKLIVSHCMGICRSEIDNFEDTYYGIISWRKGFFSATGKNIPLISHSFSPCHQISW